MKRITRNIAIVLTVLWSVFLVMNVVAYATFQGDPKEGALGVYMERAMYIWGSVGAALGVFCSVMLAVCMHQFRDAWYYGLKRSERLFIDSAVCSNVLLYLSVILLFVPSFLTLLVLIAWAIATMVCLGTLIWGCFNGKKRANGNWK